VEVMVHPDQLEAARALGPIQERQVFGRRILLFDGVARPRLEAVCGAAHNSAEVELNQGFVGQPGPRYVDC